MDAPPEPRTPREARRQVTVLYEEHALGLVKLAKIMLGDQGQAEDTVQDAFLGLYRKWPYLNDHGQALAYLRASVLNGCRTVYRGRTRRDRALLFFVPKAEEVASAEESAVIGEANREVMAALRALPARQREAVVLRYYLDLSEAQTAEAMHVTRGTVKSATSRGLAALARMLKEDQ
jgi:RNA polymerase sigma-70 factor (sigma-E family)